MSTAWPLWQQSWRDTCWGSTNTEQSFLLLQPYSSSLWFLMGGKTNVLCTAKMAVFGAFLLLACSCPPSTTQCHCRSCSAQHATLPCHPFHLLRAIPWPKHVPTTASSKPNFGPASWFCLQIHSTPLNLQQLLNFSHKMYSLNFLT